jgi:hypothetical protein
VLRLFIAIGRLDSSRKDSQHYLFDRRMNWKISTTLFAFLPSGLTIFSVVFQNEGACHAEGSNE